MRHLFGAAEANRPKPLTIVSGLLLEVLEEAE